MPVRADRAGARCASDPHGATSSRTPAAIRRRSCSRSPRSSQRGLVAPGATVIANSASGVTGAGNSPEARAAVRRGRRGLSAYGVGNTHRHLAEMRATLGALGARRRPRVHAAPAAGRARHPVDDHGAAHRRRSTIRSRSGATRTPASRSSRSPTSSRRCATSCTATSCASAATTIAGHAHADAARHVGDRQPGEGRGGPGAAEREPHARPRRDAGAARMTRVIKIGGRPQLDPSLPRGDRAPRSGQRRARWSSCTAAATKSARCSGATASTRDVRRRAARHERAATSRSCAWRSRASANKRLVAALVGAGVSRRRALGRGRRRCSRPTPLDAEQLRPRRRRRPR